MIGAERSESEKRGYALRDTQRRNTTCKPSLLLISDLGFSLVVFSAITNQWESKYSDDFILNISSVIHSSPMDHG